MTEKEQDFLRTKVDMLIYDFAKDAKYKLAAFYTLESVGMNNDDHNWLFQLYRKWLNEFRAKVAVDDK